MASERRLYPHDWTYYGKGDFPRWAKFVCRKCGGYGDFHLRFPIEDQTRNNCPL